MSGEKSRSDKFSSFIEIFEETKKKIDSEWPDWKKRITPFETTASTITNQLTDSKKASMKKGR